MDVICTFAHCTDNQQGNYYSEPYGKPHTETDQAKDAELGANFWDLCSQFTQEILGEKLA